MYGNGLASNTKYTDFIKFYDYDDHDRHHLLERQVNNNNSSVQQAPNSVVTSQQQIRQEIVTSVQVHRKASSVVDDEHDGGMGMKDADVSGPDSPKNSASVVLAAKTKFADIFTAAESNALRQLLKDRERVGVTKTLSESDLLKLHDAVKRNFELSARLFDVKVRRGESERERAEEEELREIETDVRRVNEETLRALAAVSAPEGEEFGDVRRSTSYRTMLQAEHVALRRELLNNLRQLSKGTYKEVVAEEEVEKQAEHLVEEPLKTADPAERVGEWLQKSQEHLSGAGGADAEETKGKSTSLFHDAMWKEEPEFDNEDPQVQKAEWSDGILEVRRPEVVESPMSPGVFEDEGLQVEGQELEGPSEVVRTFDQGAQDEVPHQGPPAPMGTETKFVKQYSKDVEAIDEMLPLEADAGSLSQRTDSPEPEERRSPEESSPEAELMALEEETSPLPEDPEYPEGLEEIAEQPEAVLTPELPVETAAKTDETPNRQVTQRTQTSTIRQPFERPPTPYPQEPQEPQQEAQVSHRSIAVSIPENEAPITETKFSRIHRRPQTESPNTPLHPPQPQQLNQQQTEIIVLPASTRTEPAEPPEGVLAAEPAALAPPPPGTSSSEHRRFSKFQRRKKHASSTTDLSHYGNRTSNLGGTSLDPNYRSYSYTNVNRIRVYPTVAIIPQPTLEKYPERIFKPKENYQLHSSVTPRTLSRLSNNNYHSDYSLYESSDASNTLLVKSKPFSSNTELATTVQAAGDVIITGGGYLKNKSQHNSRSKMPGVLRRHNPEQWVAKKVYFFVNGDEHYPKFEYRFRPFKDVKNLDTLYDILSKRLNLSHGVRHIFTIDGQPVRHLGEFKNEHFYVASSTKKFKVKDKDKMLRQAKPAFNTCFKAPNIATSVYK